MKEKKLYFIVNLVFIALLVILAVLRENGDAMLSIAFPLALVTSLAIAYASKYEGDMRITMAFVFLFETGQLLQVLISNDGGSDVRMWIFLTPILGFIGAFIILSLGNINYKKQRRKSSNVIIGVASMAFLVFIAGMLLLVFGSEINGTKAWLQISSLRFEPTEFFKISFMITFAMLFSSHLDEKKIFIISTLHMLLCIGFLLVINELGSMLTIILMWIIFTFIYLNTIKYTVISIGSTLLTLGIGGAAVWIIRETTASKTEKQLGKVMGLLSRISRKLYMRFMMFWDYEAYLKEYEDLTGSRVNASHQPVSARDMIIRGGLLGNENHAYVDEQATDYAFVSLIFRFGVIFALVIIAVFLFIFIKSIIPAAANKNKYESVIWLGSSLCIVLPTMINLFGTTNFFMLTGIAIPFLSDGHTNAVVSIACSMILIWSSCQNKPYWSSKLFSRRKHYRIS